MKSASSPVCRAALAAAVCLLTQCAMPPREAWNIVRSDGLITYWMGDYSRGALTSRYLSNSAPLQRSTQAFPRIPYRPPNHTSSRYMANTSADTDSYQSESNKPPYRPRSTAVVPKKKSLPESDSDLDSPAVVTTTEPKRLDKTPTPKTKSSDTPAKLSLEDLPFGSPVGGRPGMVNSPFATKDQLVDVTGMSVGETVKCPYSGKLFRVPPTQQAASKSTSESSPPEPSEEPKPAPEPKSAPAPEPKSEPAPDKPAADPAKPAADTGSPKS